MSTGTGWRRIDDTNVNFQKQLKEAPLTEIQLFINGSPGGWNGRLRHHRLWLRLRGVITVVVIAAAFVQFNHKTQIDISCPSASNAWGFGCRRISLGRGWGLVFRRQLW